MASNKNIPQKDQGANNPDSQQSLQSDAADVDWMIMSDISTRIGGSPEIKSNSNQPSAKSSSQIPSNHDADHDLEDLEFLRSIGLDEEIERLPSSRNTANTSGSYGSKATDNNEVNNIDWLIVTDLNIRKENAEIKEQSNLYIGQSQTTLQPLTDSMMDGLDEDFGLDELDFSEGSDFPDLDSLGLGSLDSLNIDGLQNEIDNTEGKIQGLAELLDDNDDSSFDLIASDENDDWDSISGIFENDFNQLSSEPVLDIADESPEILSSVSEFFETTEDASGNIDLDSGLFSEDNDPADLLVNDLDLSNEIQADQIVEDFEISNDFQRELQDNLQNEQDQDPSFNGFEVGSLEAEFDNKPDDDFGAAQSLEVFESSVAEDDFWSNTSSNLESESVLDESVENTFTNDWGEIAENAIDDAAIWDTKPSLATDIGSSINMDDPFGANDLERLANTDQPEIEEHIDFDLPNLDPLDSSIMEDYVNLELVNADSSLESIRPELEPEFESEFNLQPEPIFEQSFDQIDNELEAGIRLDENWSMGIETNDITNDSLGAVMSWDTSLEEDNVIVTDPNEETDWSASLEAEISNGNDVVWDEASVEIEDYLPPAEESSEFVNDNLLGLVDSDITEQPFPEESDFGDNLDANDWAIAGQVNNLTDSLSESEAVNLQIPEIYDDFNDISENLDISEQIANQQQFTDFNEFIDPSHDDIGASSNLADNFASYDEAGDIGSILDEDFDLASFDEDSLLEAANSDRNFDSIPTTLTPSRSTSDTFLVDPFSEDSLASGFTNQPYSINPIDSFADNIDSQSDSFEEALVNGLLNENYEEVNFEEEALAHDLLNGLVSESDGFPPAKESPTMSTPMLTPNSNLEASIEFDLGTSDRDFLDDFDLESIDPIGDSGFAAGLVSTPISTGLTPSVIAPMPPSPPPLAKQEPTAPSISNLPPPPPFLPPLPPKRTPTQGSTTPAPAYPAINTGSQPLPQNRMGKRSGEDDFDRFHSQPDQHRSRSKPIGSIDEGWSDLLDADTVLSVGRSSYSDTSRATPPSPGKSAGRSSQGGERKDRNSPPNISRRKETGLPDFNDLGLEVHADNTDWSGLLDSGDLSDSITTISPQSTQLPSRIRSNPIADSRSDMSGVSETREIPRNRRKPMVSFGDSTQARMSTSPDQIDFNRFTEDNYDEYSGYEQSSAPSAIKTPNKPKLTIPSISLESLWQNYLKIPAIGLGAIGGAFLLYTFLNRPIFDLGLRWGMLKDASGKDFTNADFKGAKLDNVDFSKATLTGAKMQEASLVGANFQGANLDGVNFTKANLNRARLIQSSVIWAEFNNAQMNLVDLAGADLTRSNFAGAKMEGANLKDSKIGAQGTEKATKFSATTLLAWQIVNEPREGRNLADQDLSGLNLSFTSLKRANLSNAKLNYTDLTNTDLSGANLSGGQINGANLSGAKLNGINLNDVTFDKSKLPKTDEETICPNGKKGPCKF